MPLKDLLVTEHRATEEVLERILQGLALLAEDTRRIRLTALGARLPSRAKVLLVLTAQHAWRFVVGEEIGDSPLTVADICSQAGLKGNTARPVLKTLKDEGVIESPSPGAYRLPAFALALVDNELAAVRRRTSDEPAKT